MGSLGPSKRPSRPRPRSIEPLHGSSSWLRARLLEDENRQHRRRDAADDAHPHRYERSADDDLGVEDESQQMSQSDDSEQNRYDERCRLHRASCLTRLAYFGWSIWTSTPPVGWQPTSV